MERFLLFHRSLPRFHYCIGTMKSKILTGSHSHFTCPLRVFPSFCRIDWRNVSTFLPLSPESLNDSVQNVSTFLPKSPFPLVWSVVTLCSLYILAVPANRLMFASPDLNRIGESVLAALFLYLSSFLWPRLSLKGTSFLFPFARFRRETGIAPSKPLTLSLAFSVAREAEGNYSLVKEGLEPCLLKRFDASNLFLSRLSNSPIV